MTCWTVILAAGGSTRFGSPKALAPWQGGTLLSHAIATVRTVCGENFMVVTGGYANIITSTAPDGKTVFNPDWENGIGTSIITGTKAILTADHLAECIIILLVDMPLIDARHLQLLAAKAITTACCVLTEDHGVSGAPAAIPKNLFKRLLTLPADKGLKAILSLDEIKTISAPGCLRDIDTPQDLAILQQASKRSE